MKSFFILWNPFSDLPPTARFSTRKQAAEAARRMAAVHGGTFYVCKAQGMARRIETVDFETLGSK